MNGILYLISDKCEYAVKLILNGLSENVAICLLQDAVYLACKGTGGKISEALDKGIQVYAIEKDVHLRGLEGILIPDVKLIRYTDFIDLVFGYDRVINL